MAEEKTMMDRLMALSIGERAALKREAGKCLAEADAEALTVFFRIVPRGLKIWEQECWFSVATIACLWKLNEADAAGEFPSLLGRYAAGGRTEGVEKKLQALLDARWDNDGYFSGKLSRLARMLKSKMPYRMPDFDRLWADLKHWNSDKRFVQIRWVQLFYQAMNEEE